MVFPFFFLIYYLIHFFSFLFIIILILANIPFFQIDNFFRWKSVLFFLKSIPFFLWNWFLFFSLFCVTFIWLWFFLSDFGSFVSLHFLPVLLSELALWDCSLPCTFTFYHHTLPPATPLTRGRSPPRSLRSLRLLIAIAKGSILIIYLLDYHIFFFFFFFFFSSSFSSSSEVRSEERSEEDRPRPINQSLSVSGPLPFCHGLSLLHRTSLSLHLSPFPLHIFKFSILYWISPCIQYYYRRIVGQDRPQWSTEMQMKAKVTMLNVV